MSKRYFDIKRYPGYTITTTGKVHKKDPHYPMGLVVEVKKSARGEKYVCLVDKQGNVHYEFVSDLLAETFPEKKPKKLNVDLDDWAVVEGHPRYEINRAGQVRQRDTWVYIPLCTREGKNCPIYYLDNKPKYVNTLLLDAFGPGAAEQAGYPEPRRLDRRKK